MLSVHTHADHDRQTTVILLHAVSAGGSFDAFCLSASGQTLLPGMAPHSLIVSLSESHLLSGWMARNICTSNCPMTDGPNYGRDLSLCYLLFLQACSYRPSFGLFTCVCLFSHSL